MMTNDIQVIEAALAALRAVEWSYSASGFSPVCYWCRGYERHPAMDQDYYGKAGHKPDCPRQTAIAGLERLLAELRDSHPRAGDA